MYRAALNNTLFSMKVDDIRAAGAGGKLDTDALKQSDLYLGKNNGPTCSGYQMCGCTKNLLTGLTPFENKPN